MHGEQRLTRPEFKNDSPQFKPLPCIEPALPVSRASCLMFTTDKPEWAKKPTQSWHKDVWDIYFMGWGVPEGKLLTYEAYHI